MTNDYSRILANQLDAKIINQQLSTPQPVLHSPENTSHAAVALIIEPAGKDHWSILFIERATRKGDPWSGQIAFPGGRRERHDVDSEAVALRETEEEIGIRINERSVIGRLDDLPGRHGGTSAGMVISCFVYMLDHVADIRVNNEVKSVVRVPVDHLLDINNYVNVLWAKQQEICYPGISFGDDDKHIVWGLTYRFLRTFFNRLGCRLPEAAILREQQFRQRPFY